MTKRVETLAILSAALSCVTLAYSQTTTCCTPGPAPAIAAADARPRIERLQEELLLLQGDGRRDTDTTTLAQSLDHDLDRCFRFVRDELLFHPYRGVLRGGRGALLAGAANSTDRCLLLAELIKSGPQPLNTRFAFGRLSRQQADQLIDRALASTPGKLAYRPIDTSRLLKMLGKTAADLAEADRMLGRRTQPYAKLFLEGFLQDSMTIHNALQNAGMKLDGDAQDGVEATAARLRDHIWLQVLRNGEWIDLDPSFSDARIGWKPAEPSRTVESLPMEEHCRLQIKIVAEKLTSRKLSVNTLYERAFLSSRLAGESLELTVMPEKFSWATFQNTKPNQSPLHSLLPAMDRYQIVISQGEHQEQSRLFDLQGRVFASNSTGGFSELGSVVGNRVGNLLTRGLGGARRDVAAESVLSGVRLELTFSDPERRPRTETRYLLDRLQPGSREDGRPQLADNAKDEKRAGISLIQSWTLWPATGTLNDAFLTERWVRVFGKGGPVTVVLDLAEEDTNDDIPELAKHVDPLPLSIVGFVQTAQTLCQGTFRPGEGACFIDRPSLFIWKEALTTDDGDTIRARRGVDIVHAPLGVLATDVRKAAQARSIYGLLLSEGESATVQLRVGTAVSTARVFQVARDEQIPLMTMVDRDQEQVDSLDISPEARVRIRRSLRTGDIVIVPKRSVTLAGRARVAWWRIDPRNGECLGVGETGEGQAVSEGLLVLEHISIPLVEKVMTYVACLNAGIAGGKSIQQAGSECGMQFMKDYVKDTLAGAVEQFLFNPGFWADSVAPGGDGADWAAGTSPGDRGLRESQMIDEKLNEPTFRGLADQARDHYGNYDKAKGLAGKVNTVVTVSQQINDLTSQVRPKE